MARVSSAVRKTTKCESKSKIILNLKRSPAPRMARGGLETCRSVTRRYGKPETLRPISFDVSRVVRDALFGFSNIDPSADS